MYRLRATRERCTRIALKSLSAVRSLFRRNLSDGTRDDQHRRRVLRPRLATGA
jgi:hypothetical protein